MCRSRTHATLGTDGFVEVRGRSGKLRCRYNPATHELEFYEHGRREVIDLKPYHQRHTAHGTIADQSARRQD